MSQRVVVAGSSGLIGGALCASLRGRGDEVVRLVRRPGAAPDEVTWDPSSGVLPMDALDGVAAVVNLAGAGVGDRRWSEDYKRTIVSSRLDTTGTLAEAVAGLATSGQSPRLVVGTAVGYYGDRGEEELTEESAKGDGFLADLVRDWEAAADPAIRAGVSTAFARTGLVLTPEGGAMAPILTLARLGLAGPMGSGRQYWPWITLEDEVRALLHLIDSPDVVGPVNLASPAPARQREITSALGAALHRPALLPAPALALRLVVGGFAGEILGSQRIVGRVLADSGFAWSQPDLASAVHWLLTPSTARTS